jgi:hypothetical protein
MDGTLVDVSSIRHLVAEGEKIRNFDEFHKRSVDCPPINWVKAHAIAAKELGFTVLQVTARSEKYQSHTAWWLADQRVPSDGLYMRGRNDFRPDADVKRDIIDRILRKYEIVKAFDDNPSVVRLWDEYGIYCVVVPGWVD